MVFKTRTLNNDFSKESSMMKRSRFAEELKTRCNGACSSANPSFLNILQAENGQQVNHICLEVTDDIGPWKNLLRAENRNF